MSKFSSWPIKEVQVTNLKLDSRNPRIPSHGPAKRQRELIAELITHDNVYDLAKGIVNNGYFPLETLIGLTEDGDSIILEGNRRLAALKVLISPELAPVDVQSKFRKLSTKIDPSDIRKVRVLFAPTREAAAPLIMQKHTREQVLRWSPLMQARFFQELLRDGMDVEDMAREYLVSPANIAKALRLDTMYSIACTLDLSMDDQSIVRDPRNFPGAVLERLLEVPKVRELMGISFDEQGKLVGNVKADEFIRVYSRMVSDIAKGKIDTRKANTADQAVEYMQGLGTDAVDLSKSGSFSADDLTVTRNPDEKKQPTKQPKTQPGTVIRLSKSLVPHGFKCNFAIDKINQVFLELKDLKVGTFPNASAAVLRMLLELSLGHYLNKTGKMEPMLNTHKVEKKRDDWYPSWKQMLQAVLQDKTVKFDRTARKALSKLASDKDYSYLDGVVHNRFVPADVHQLRSFADAVFELLPHLFAATAPSEPAHSISEGE